MYIDVCIYIYILCITYIYIYIYTAHCPAEFSLPRCSGHVFPRLVSFAGDWIQSPQRQSCAIGFKAHDQHPYMELAVVGQERYQTFSYDMLCL